MKPYENGFEKTHLPQQSEPLLWIKKIQAIKGDVAQACLLLMLDQYTIVHCNIIHYAAC